MSARTALRSAGSHLSRRLGRRAGGIAEVLGRQTGLNRTERCDVVRRERPDQRRDPVDSADIDEHARVDVVDLQLWLVVREARWDLLDHRIHKVDPVPSDERLDLAVMHKPRIDVQSRLRGALHMPLVPTELAALVIVIDVHGPATVPEPPPAIGQAMTGAAQLDATERLRRASSPDRALRPSRRSGYRRNLGARLHLHPSEGTSIPRAGAPRDPPTEEIKAASLVLSRGGSTAHLARQRRMSRPGVAVRGDTGAPLARQRGARSRWRDTPAESSGAPARRRSCGREGSRRSRTASQALVPSRARTLLGRVAADTSSDGACGV